MLHVALTVATAACISGATLLSDMAADRSQELLRGWIAWSAGVQEDVRFVYQDEAPVAWQAETNAVLGAGLTAAATASGLAGPLAQVQAQGHSRTAHELRAAHKDTDSLVGDERYRLPDGGVDVSRRFADLRRRGPQPVAPSPPIEADPATRYATVLSAVSVVLVGLQVLVMIVGGARTRRRQLGVAAFGSPPAGQSPFVRSVAVALPALAWVAVAVLPAMQLQYAKQEQRAQLAATWQAVELSTAISCSAALRNFSWQSMRTVLELSSYSIAEQLGALDSADPAIADATTVVASSRQSALGELDRIRQIMTRPPDTSDGIDLATVRIINAGLGDIARLGDRQRYSADQARSAGRRANVLGLSVFLAAAALAIQPARRGRAGVVACTGLLLGSAAGAVLAIPSIAL